MAPNHLASGLHTCPHPVLPRILLTSLQLLFPSIVLVFSFLLPESPRWLYVHNKKEQAKAMLVKYHGNGNENSAWVSLQLREYEECLNLDGADKRWWDYRVLFKKGNFYRLCCNLIVSTFSQLAGNAVLSYFLGSVLDSAGYRSYLSQANITLINNCVQFLCAICGALLVDRVGRRPLLLFAFSSCTVVWLGMTIATSQFAASYVGKDASGAEMYSDGAASKAALAMIFLFGAAFSIGITPLQGLYIVEVLSFEMRAKGMAMSNLAGMSIFLSIETVRISNCISYGLTHHSKPCRFAQPVRLVGINERYRVEDLYHFYYLGCNFRRHNLLYFARNERQNGMYYPATGSGPVC